MRFFTATDGTRIAYRDEGTGVPVVALAGLTRDGRDFDYWANHMPADVRLIRIDSRGRGQSEWSGAATYTVPQEAADVLALLDHLGLDKVAVLGTSRGGIIGMGLAAFAKDRLLGVCLNDVGPVLEAEGLDRIKNYIGVEPTVQTLQDAAERLPAAHPDFEGVSEFRWGEEAVRHFVDKGDHLGLTYDPALRTSFLEAMEGPAVDLWPWFDACEGLPLALLRGANSDLLSKASAADMRLRRPDMVFAEVPGRGHIPFLDEPESVAAINDWLDLIRAKIA